MNLSDLAAAVRSGRTSPSSLVELSLDRIDRLNPPLNAVIRVREQALDDARAMDARIAADEDPGPLAGLPLLVKDMEAVTGMPSTFGSLTFSDAAPASSDGLVPRRLRAAGAIVVGKTNQPEFAFAGFTTNALYGTTTNPWGTDWSPGGSSGGSGAALASGMAAIATATDGGGSIRSRGVLRIGGAQADERRDRPRPHPRLDRPLDVRTARDVDRRRAPVAVAGGRTVPGDPSALPFPLLLGTGLPTRVLAVPRFEGAHPLPDGVSERFEAAIASVERDLGLSVEMLDAGSVFTHGSTGDDWYTLTAFEHFHRLGRAFIEANMDRFTPAFAAPMRWRCRHRRRPTWPPGAGGSITSGTWISSSATTRSSSRPRCPSRGSVRRVPAPTNARRPTLTTPPRRTSPGIRP